LFYATVYFLVKNLSTLFFDLIEVNDLYRRDECLNVNWFLSLEDARAKIKDWRCDYNGSRPHTSLGDQTPWEFARCHLVKAPVGGSAKVTSTPTGRHWLGETSTHTARNFQSGTIIGVSQICCCA